MPQTPTTEPVDFPTLWVALDWISAHCVIPDGFRKGEPFVPYTDQLAFLARHYRVREVAERGQLAPAFTYRRSQLVRPQKYGKGPLTAAMVALEGVGPAVFAGWAVGGEWYACADHGCRCGWAYRYERGEPMGTPWPTPLIQITAFSEDQTGNVYDAFRPMVTEGPLYDLIPRVGEEFTRLPGGGRIDTVTSKAQSRLGQRVTFVVQDETGIWTPNNGMVRVAETQRRGLSGMGGRAVETTNAWDPSEQSVAQRTSESAVEDVWRDHKLAPAWLSYKNKAERRKIHRTVYGDALKSRGGHVDLDSIEAEAAELLELDPQQAERFYGNRAKAGSGAWIEHDAWALRTDATVVVADKEQVALGFDGSLRDDATALVGCTQAGHLFLLGVWEKPDGARGAGWEVPHEDVVAAVDAAFRRFKVVRFYCDPPNWQDTIGAWSARHGKDVVFEFWTNQKQRAARALEQFHTAVMTGAVTHDGDSTLSRHVLNAVRGEKISDIGWLIKKERPHSPRKIDAAMAAVLAYEARTDALAAGQFKARTGKVYGFR